MSEEMELRDTLKQLRLSVEPIMQAYIEKRLSHVEFGEIVIAISVASMAADEALSRYPDNEGDEK